MIELVHKRMSDDKKILVEIKFYFLVCIALKLQTLDLDSRIFEI